MLEDLGVGRGGEVAVLLAGLAVGLTTRSMSCLQAPLAVGVPTAPRKYFVVTMLAALTLQESGNSTRAARS